MKDRWARKRAVACRKIHMRTLYLCGAGNSEGVRLSQRVAQSDGRWDRIVLLDDDPRTHGQSILGVEIAGSFNALTQADPSSSEVANLIARTTIKRWVSRQRIESFGLRFASLISPEVDIAGADLEADVVVYHNATVGPQTSIGSGSVVFMGAVVGHESRVGRGCIVAANAVLNARVQLGDGVYVGTNAAVLPEVKIGEWATIAAGSVAAMDVPAGATLMGVPGKVILTAELKFKMQAFEALPEPVLRRLRGHAGSDGGRAAATAGSTP